MIGGSDGLEIRSICKIIEWIKMATVPFSTQYT
jgi:heptaprenylglyceryl phosphate synthase